MPYQVSCFYTDVRFQVVQLLYFCQMLLAMDRTLEDVFKGWPLLVVASEQLDVDSRQLIMHYIWCPVCP